MIEGKPFHYDEMKKKLEASNFDNIKTGDMLVYYKKENYDNGKFVFRHVGVIIDVKNSKGRKLVASMGASELKNDDGKLIGGVGPRSSGWGYIQSKEQIQKSFGTDYKSNVLYQDVNAFKSENGFKLGSDLCKVFIWPY